MPWNLEYKSKVGGLKSLEEIFVDHGAALVESLDQLDTYFCVLSDLFLENGQTPEVSG